jgi:hypothetical protein
MSHAQNAPKQRVPIVGTLLVVKQGFALLRLKSQHARIEDGGIQCHPASHQAPVQSAHMATDFPRRHRHVTPVGRDGTKRHIGIQVEALPVCLVQYGHAEGSCAEGGPEVEIWRRLNEKQARLAAATQAQEREKKNDIGVSPEVAYSANMSRLVQ